MSPCAEHVFDRFNATMRGTVLRQYAKGLAGCHHDHEEAEEVDRALRRIKGFLWHGNLHAALPCIDDLAMDLECIETRYPSIKAFCKGVREFQTCIANNAHAIPNYAERHRYGERVSTAFVESTVNTVVGKRFSKKQQMRWSKSGAHLVCFKLGHAFSTAPSGPGSSPGIPASSTRQTQIRQWTEWLLDPGAFGGSPCGVILRRPRSIRRGVRSLPRLSI